MKSKQTIAATAIFFFVMYILAGPLLADDIDGDSAWPEFHGPGRTNISPDRGLLKKWPDGGPRKLWTYSQCGRGFSGVSIADGKIFTAGDFGAEEMVIALNMDGRLYGSACRMGGKGFYCVDFLTGKTIKIDNTMGKVGITCADGMIYALNHQGTMYLLALTEDGFEKVSRFQLKKMPTNSYLAHPVVCGGKLYIRCGPDLHAFDIRAN